MLHDSYRIVTKIGDGGMGTVYEAVHVRLARKRFAVKILSSAVSGSKEIYARFRREAEIATELGHENIVDVVDFNETPQGQPYMVMELLDGVDLGSWLREHGPLPAGAVTRVLEQVGSALQAAHYRGIVHRDMKPENIFLVEPLESFKVKVLDFGISKIRDSKTVVTQHKAVFGTPYYMSPEQAEGSVEDIDHTTDIFALGAICYQCLSGALPFDAPTIPGVLYRVCHVEPDPISDVVPGVPEELDDVLARAMAKRKQDRYQRVDDFVKEVAAVLDAVEPSRIFARATIPDHDLGPTQTGPELPRQPAAPPPAAITGPGQPVSAGAPAQPGGYRPTTPYGGQVPEQWPPLAKATTLSEAAGEEANGEEAAAFGVGSRKTILTIAASVVLLLAAGIVAWVVFSGEGQERPAVDGVVVAAPPQQPDAAATAVKPDAAAVAGRPDAAMEQSRDAAPTAVRVTLELVPPSARVVLDGERVRDNPLVLPRGDAAHELLVSAPGYEPARQRLRATEDQKLRISLAPVKVTKPAKPAVDGPKPKKPNKPRKPGTKKPRGPRFDDL